MKILALVDSKNKENELKKVLDEEKNDLIFSGSPREFMQILENDYQIDLMLVDSKSLAESKTDLIRHAKAASRFQWIPMLALCDNCQIEYVMSMINRGIHDIIAYPLDKKRVQAKLKNAIINGRRRIVVVDDDPGVLEILCDIMELDRHIVFPFSSAEGALKFLRETQNINAVVSDILLPGMSGFELMERIKGIYDYIPVILVTGHSGKYSPRMAIEHGADGYFKKPFHNKELLRTLEAVLLKYKRYHKVAPVPISESSAV